MRHNLIKDIRDYDPKSPNNAQLADDWRIAAAWYASIKAGKKFEFTKEDVIKVAKIIYKEIVKRVKAGKMKHEFQPDKMTPTSKELYETVSKAESTEHSESAKEPSEEMPMAGTDEQFMPIYPGSESKVYDLLTLDEFIARFETHILRDPFITIVGSLANFEETTGDIDILVKANENEEIFKLAKWRLQRAFPELEDRIHVFGDEWHGPFTSHVPLARLVVEKLPFEIHQMSKIPAKKIQLLKFLPLLKPLHGRTKGEIYSIDSVIRTVKSRKKDWFETGIFVETKFDGVHSEAHKKGDTVKIFTEEGRDITENCPTLVSELKEIEPDFILVAEIELWKDDTHLPRADVAGILNVEEVSPDERLLRANIFDRLYDSRGDIHLMPFTDRLDGLDQIPNSEHIKKSNRTLTHSEAELRKAIKKASAREGSEGAMLKLADFKYNLTGRTTENMKFKKELSLDAVVLKRNRVAKTEKTFFYHCGLADGKGITYCGKTFNTNIDAKPGDILKVVFVDVSGYTTKAGKRWVNWWAPRPIELRTDKKGPDTIETAWRMVKQTTGRFEEKELPTISKQFLQAKAKKFVMQHHFRGASEHIDFRYQINHVLAGFTIAAQRPDILKDELDKHWKLEKTAKLFHILWDKKLFYELDKKLDTIKEPSASLKKEVYDFHRKLNEDPKYWKVDMQTGEELKREKDGEPAEKIFCVKKAREPYEWLFVKGVTPPREIEPVPGGTRFYPGIFVEIDSGEIYLGAQKAYFKEFFLRGKSWKGRYVFRFIPGLKGAKAIANWLYWKPDDQLPYVLSSRAIKKKWLPDKGSAMPPEWERRLPPELQFWKKKSTADKLESRALASKYIKEKQKGKQATLASKGKNFVLTRRHWKGQFVIRGAPFEDWHIKFDKFKFHLDRDPGKNKKDISAIQFEKLETFFQPGEKKPNSKANPNKKIPAFIEIIDTDSFEVIESTPTSIRISFKGKKLKGTFTLIRESPRSVQWTMKKSEAPKT